MQRLQPLTELRAFASAARHLSFKAAAAELGVTPTAVSHQIRLLEGFVGQALFRRRPRPLSLTRAGEALFPVVQAGFEAMAEALGQLRQDAASGTLRVTATNAFASRVLVPALARLREAYPRLRLEIIGTDAVLDLAAGDADLAIRYARLPPAGVQSVELFRDRFHVLASPALLRGRGADLAALPLIDSEWLPGDTGAPTWARFEAEARRRDPAFPPLAEAVAVTFREELHAIEAAIAGQGVAICSDVVAAAEMADGRLVPVSDITLPGYGFHAAWRAGHPKEAVIRAVAEWLQGHAVPQRRNASGGGTTLS